MTSKKDGSAALWAVQTIGPNDDGREEWLRAAVGDALSVLASSYGTNYRGHLLHTARLRTSNPWVFIGRSVQTGQTCGFSYVHVNGKRGATGVLPKQQRRGLGAAMIEASVVAVRDQWAEVGAGQTAQQSALASAGFSRVGSWRKAAGLLGPLLLPLVISAEEPDSGITYVRYSYRAPVQLRRYCMMTIGHPANSPQQQLVSL